MAKGAGHEQVLKVDDAVDSLTDISQYLTSVNMAPQNRPAIDVTTITNNFSEHVRGIINTEAIEVEGVWEHDIGSVLHNLGTAGDGDFEYYPQGTSAGAPKFSGSCWLMDYSGPQGGLEDAVTFSASFKVTGTITFGTV